MNTKTTLFLAFTLVALVVMLFVVKSRSADNSATIAILPAKNTSTTTHDLFEEKLGDIVMVSVSRPDGETWVFEKEAESKGVNAYSWHSTQPREMPCTRWEVDKFGNQIGSLTYELSYQAGDSGAITAQQAGLDPPRATVTLTNAEGREESVEVGKRAGIQQTYVRMAGGDTIFVGQADLGGLMKDRLLDFRDQQVWNFKAREAKRIEIEDRSDLTAPVTYLFEHDGSHWMMHQPLSARVTRKVDDMLNALTRLRATSWYDDRPGSWDTYGLNPAPLTVRVTVETEVDDEGEAPPTEATEEGETDTVPEPPTIETTVYEIHLSSQSPIGEESKVFFRVGDQGAIATMLKTKADKLKPVMGEWRDMHIISSNAKNAARIEMLGAEGFVAMENALQEWSFERDGGRAESEPVSTLLTAIANLKAVVFVEDHQGDPVQFGFDQPQADIRLTIPGVEGVEQLTIGSYTDPRTKRLVYVGYNQMTTVAKVRRSDVEALLKESYTYRDRVVLDVLPSRFKQITISTHETMSARQSEITLGNTDGQWRMTDPISATIERDKVDPLIEVLGNFRADQVVAEEAEGDAYGLHAPLVTVTVTYSAESDQSMVDNTTLLFSKKDDQGYVKRADRDTIYSIKAALLDKLTTEFRVGRVLDFDAQQVDTFSIRDGDTQHVFERQDGRWIYGYEPDMPLDHASVENLLLQLRDLRTARFIQHQDDAPLSPLGLDAPRQEVLISMNDDTIFRLRISQLTVSDGTLRGYYAIADGVDGIFLLTDADLNRFRVNLDELETDQ